MLALQLLEQVVFAGCYVVDQFLRKRFLIGERLGLADCGFGDLNIAAALRNYRSQQGGGIILDFFLHRVVHLAAAERDGMSRAGVGSGRHGRNVGAFENEKSGGRGPASAGRDVDDYGHRRGQDFFDDVAGGFKQAAGSVDLDEQGVIFVAFCFGDGAANVFIGDGMDRVVHDDLQYFGGRSGAQDEQQQSGQKGGEKCAKRKTVSSIGQWLRFLRELGCDGAFERQRGRIGWF